MQVKSNGNSLLGLAVEFSSAIQEKKSVFLAAPGNTLLTMNQFSRRFPNVIMPRRVMKLEEAPGWVLQESTIEMDGYTLKEIHAICYQSEPASEYHTVLGDLKISATGENSSFPPSASWIVDTQFVSWSSGSEGSQHLSVKMLWKLKDGEADVFPKYNIYVNKLKSSLGENEIEASEGVPEFLGVAVVNTFYVSDVGVPSATSSLKFTIQVCGADGTCQKLELSPSYILPVES